nr:hypothetical protein [Myxococcales bacterium]
SYAGGLDPLSYSSTRDQLISRCYSVFKVRTADFMSYARQQFSQLALSITSLPSLFLLSFFSTNYFEVTDKPPSNS